VHSINVRTPYCHISYVFNLNIFGRFPALLVFFSKKKISENFSDTVTKDGEDEITYVVSKKIVVDDRNKEKKTVHVQFEAKMKNLANQNSRGSHFFK